MKDRDVFAGISLGALQKKKILFCILLILITAIAFIGWGLSCSKNLPLDEVKKVAIKNGNTGNRIELSDKESEQFINTLQSFDFQRSKKIKEESVGWSVWVSLENGNRGDELFLEETYIEYNNYFYKTKSTAEYSKFWEYWLENSKYDFMEDTARENMFFCESFGKAVTQIEYYVGRDIPYEIKDETIIQEFFDILTGLTYREIENPMYEGG